MALSLTRWSAGSEVDVQLARPHLYRLQAAAEDVKRRLHEYVGGYEVSDSFRVGKEEMSFGIKPAAEALCGGQPRSGFAPSGAGGARNRSSTRRSDSTSRRTSTSSWREECLRPRRARSRGAALATSR